MKAWNKYATGRGSVPVWRATFARHTILADMLIRLGAHLVLTIVASADKLTLLYGPGSECRWFHEAVYGLRVSTKRLGSSSGIRHAETNDG